MIMACARRGLRPVMINGRMSPRSYKRWQRFSGAAQFLLGKFALLTAQDEISASRLARLGIDKVATPGNLKLDAPPLQVDADKLEALEEQLAGRAVWLAASTHPGEEEQILEAHRMIAETVSKSGQH